MELFKGAAAFIVWLSGALAAISGFLYAFGYVATLSNLYSLGLSPLVLSFDPLFYLQRGSGFTLYVLRLLFHILLIPMIAFVVVTLIVLAVTHFWRERKLTEKSLHKAGAVFGKAETWKALIYVLVLVILFWEMLTSYDDLTRILTVSDLLYETVGQKNDAAETRTIRLRQALTADRQAPAVADLIHTSFLDSVLFLLELTVLFCVAWRLTAGRRFRPLLVAPFALALAMFFVSLPMIYGILILPNKYPLVRIAAEDATIETAADYYLLNKTARELVIWDGPNKRLLWLPIGSVTKVEVDRIESLPLARGTPTSDAFGGGR
jgi:hypothetical protein